MRGAFSRLAVITAAAGVPDTLKLTSTLVVQLFVRSFGTLQKNRWD